MFVAAVWGTFGPGECAKGCHGGPREGLAELREGRKKYTIPRQTLISYIYSLGHVWFPGICQEGPREAPARKPRVLVRCMCVRVYVLV